MRVPMHVIAAVFTVLSLSGQAHATTWSEPWHREVVAAADAFGLYEVVENRPDELRLKLVKHIAGAETGLVVTVTSFYALRLTSRSASTPAEFRLPQGEQVYFYLKRTGTVWAIATPTAGYALTGPQHQVGATYRISPHQAVVEAPLYEDTQRCIFELLHGRAPCDASIGSFIQTALAAPAEGIVGNLDPAARTRFFHQHVALEMAGYMHYPVDAAALERFLAKPDMHVQLSAVRALAGSARTDRAARLMQFVEDGTANLTARTLAAMLLQETGAHEMKSRLLAYAARASDENASLGIAIMDPRIGTGLPSLRQAVKRAGEAL